MDEVDACDGEEHHTDLVNSYPSKWHFRVLKWGGVRYMKSSMVVSGIIRLFMVLEPKKFVVEYSS